MSDVWLNIIMVVAPNAGAPVQAAADHLRATLAMLNEKV